MAMAPLEQADEAPEGEALAAWFALARASVVTTTYIGSCVRALLEASVESPELAVPLLALDLLPLLRGERLLSLQPGLVVEPALRSALRRYEDLVLCPLVADPRWNAMSDAVAGLPPSFWPLAAGLTAARVLQRLGLRSSSAPSVAAIRRLEGRSPAELVTWGRTALASAATGAALAADLGALANAARRHGRLVSPADLTLVENLTALQGLGPRVALAQLAELADRIEEQLPAKGRGLRLPPGAMATPADDDSLFPVGGYASLTTTNALERVVGSELATMDDDPSARPDLFDLRLVQDELLAFSRDESVALRQRRVLALVFDPSLVDARILDEGCAVQRLTWLCAAAVVAVRRVCEAACGESDALAVELAFPTLAQGPVLSEEEALVALVLRPYRTRRQVHLVAGGHAPPRAVADELRALRRRWGRRAHVLLLTVRLPSGLEGDARPDAVVDVSSAAPALWWRDGQPGLVGGARATRAAGLDVWAELATAVIDGPHRAARTES